MTAGRYIGLISGTSMDGVDAALVDFDEDGRLEVRHTTCHPYPDDLSQRLTEAVRSADRLTALDLARLDVRVGRCFGQAALALLAEAGESAESVQAIGSHGQTLYHAPDETPPFSIQVGSPALIAEQTGRPVVSDFRAADLAAGGQGAPLAPALHTAVLASDRENRLVLNLGGIANLTWLPAQGEVLGYDTGPASCLMNEWMARHRGQPYDRDGQWAASGRVDPGLLERLMDDPYFQRPAPKSTGREWFHMTWLEKRLANPTITPEDVQATLCELSVKTIADHVVAHPGVARVIACGGGVHNTHLMQCLQERLNPIPLETTAAHGFDPDSVESVLFAWLARQHQRGQPGNIPSVTGAEGPRVLGVGCPAPGR